MATLTKAANANTVVSSPGWTTPTNAYADDGSVAAFSGANGVTWSNDFAFPAFTVDDIPNGSTINSVTVYANVWQSNAARGTCGLYAVDNGSTVGTEVTSTATSTANVISKAVAGATLADLRTAGVIEARVRCSRTSSSAFTGSLDYVYVTVDYTPPNNVTGSFTADAVIKHPAMGPNTFTADAIRLATISGVPQQFTADASRVITVTPTPFTAFATKKATISGAPQTFTADAVTKKLNVAGTPFTADAIKLHSHGGPADQHTYTVESWKMRPTLGTPWTADAIRKATITPTAPTVDAVRKQLGIAGTPFTANAVKLANSGTKTGPTLDAVRLANSGTKTGPTLDAIRKATVSVTTLKADAVQKATISVTTLKADAVIQKTISPTGWTADAVRRQTFTPTPPTVDAVRKATFTVTTFKADAVLKRTKVFQPPTTGTTEFHVAANGDSGYASYSWVDDDGWFTYPVGADVDTVQWLDDESGQGTHWSYTGLIRWDLSSMAGKTATSVTFYGYNNDGGGYQAAYVRRVADWAPLDVNDFFAAFSQIAALGTFTPASGWASASLDAAAVQAAFGGILAVALWPTSPYSAGHIWARFTGAGTAPYLSIAWSGGAAPDGSPINVDAFIQKTVTPTPFTANAVKRQTFSPTPLTVDAIIKRTWEASEPLVTLASDDFGIAYNPLVGHALAVGPYTWAAYVGSADQILTTGGYACINNASQYNWMSASGLTIRDCDVYITARQVLSSTYVGAAARRYGSQFYCYYADWGYDNVLRVGVNLQTGEVANKARSDLSGKQVRIRLQVRGASPTHVKAKVWDVSGSEPAAWDIDVYENSSSVQGLAPDEPGFHLSNSGYQARADDFLVTTKGWGDFNAPTADAVLFKSVPASFTASAVIFRSSDTFTRPLDAIKRQSFSGTWTADSWVAGHFTADAWFFGSLSFTVNAVIKRTWSGVSQTFSADAIKKVTVISTGAMNGWYSHDTFTGTQNSTLVGHVPDSGGAAWNFSWGTSVTIQSNAAMQSSGSGWGGYAGGPLYNGTDFEYVVRIKYAAGLNWPGPFSRDVSNNALYCVIQNINSTTWRMGILAYPSIPTSLPTQRADKTVPANSDIFFRVKISGYSYTRVQAMVWGVNEQMPASWDFDAYDNTWSGYATRQNQNGWYVTFWYSNLAAIDEMWSQPTFGGLSANAWIEPIHQGPFPTTADAIRRYHWWFGRLADGIDPEKPQG